MAIQPTISPSPAREAFSNNVLFFIPDISGFTKFVSGTELHHSQHIVKALLETLVDSNSIGLTVSEFEGDAILFYRHGPPPTVDEFIGQAKKMFINFHTLLKQIESYRLCQCGACSGVSKLTLKIVSHFGPASTMQVKDHTKFIGKDIIVAHRLLKNKIPHHEYFLMTDNLLKSAAGANDNLDAFDKGSELYDEIGNVEYRYMHLGKFKEEIKVEPPQPITVKNPVKVMELSQSINAPAELVYEVLIDLPARTHWMEGVKRVELLNRDKNMLGAIHKCVQEEETDELMTTAVKTTENSIEFWETDTKRKASCRFCVETISPQSARVLFELHLRGNIVLPLVFKLFMQKKMNAKIQKSLLNLKVYCEGPEMKNRMHGAEV